MNYPMRLFQEKNEFWYVEFYRGKKRSLKTRDKRKALSTYREIEKEWLKGRLIDLEKEEAKCLNKILYICHRRKPLSCPGSRPARWPTCDIRKEARNTTSALGPASGDRFSIEKMNLWGGWNRVRF